MQNQINNFGDWLERQWLDGKLHVSHEKWFPGEGVLEDGFQWLARLYTNPLEAYDFLTIDFMQEGDNSNRIIDLMGLLTGDRDVCQIQRDFMRWHIDTYFSETLEDFRKRKDQQQKDKMRDCA